MWTPPGLKQLIQLPTLPVRTQHGARRNAMLASTAMAARRRERVEVEAFLETLHGPSVDQHPELAVTGSHRHAQ